jgi:hypothetical protein
MDANEFWCRAFLAEMNGTSSRTMVNWEHERAADRFEKAADAALSVAQRRGMVTGERANNVDAAEAAEQDLLRAAEALDRGHASAQPTAPKLERVEFTATSRGDMWELHGAELGSGIQVFAGRETYPMGGATVRIKWGETMPPKPIEVWIERR